MNELVNDAPPLVSVIIPTYNYAEYIEEALSSVFAQTYRNVEIIVVDDGSTDDTNTRVSPFLNRIVYIAKINGGPSSARNEGIRRASGAFISFLDADDVWHPRKLEVELAIMRAHPSAGLVGSNALLGINSPWPKDIATSVPSDVISHRQLVLRAHFGCSVLLRRSCLERVGYFDELMRTAEDRDLWIRVAESEEVRLVRAALWKIRMHPASAIRNTRVMESGNRRLLDKAFSSARGKQLDWTCRQKAESISYFFESYGYAESRDFLASIKKLITSAAAWPLPYGQEAGLRKAIRWRFLYGLLRRIIAALKSRDASHSP